MLALKDVAIVYTVHVLHALYYGHIHTSVTFSLISFLLHSLHPSLKVFGFAVYTDMLSLTPVSTYNGRHHGPPHHQAVLEEGKEDMTSFSVLCE